MEKLIQLIKELAEEQRTLKPQRKTGTLPKFKRDYWGTPVLDLLPEDQAEKIKTAWNAATQVWHNKIRITAALNLYHEMRGSDYRHEVANELWPYSKYMKELREQFAAKTE